MEQWALVLADSVLLVVALGGAILTLVRARRVGGLAAVLAGAACGVLAVAAIFDMIWWTQVFPNAFDEDETATAATLNNLGVLGTTLMISIGVALLIVATNAGRPAEAMPSAAQPPVPQPAFQPGTPPVHQIPHQHVPQQPAYPYQAQQQAPQQAQQQPQPAAGWTPPQQQSGQPDWNIHSGVWSIPRGTFDGPPPGQQQPDQQQPR